MKGLTGIAALEAEMRDRLADKDRQIERLRKEVEERFSQARLLLSMLAMRDKFDGPDEDFWEGEDRDRIEQLRKSLAKPESWKERGE